MKYLQIGGYWYQNDAAELYERALNLQQLRQYAIARLVNAQQEEHISEADLEILNGMFESIKDCVPDDTPVSETSLCTCISKAIAYLKDILDGEDTDENRAAYRNTLTALAQVCDNNLDVVKAQLQNLIDRL